MGIEVLGPLCVGGGRVTLQRRDQVVLSALAVRAGAAMSADQLAEALWGDMPPPSWHKVVHGCVLRLRRTYGREMIETTPGGYRLTASGDELDHVRFQQLVERGRDFLATGSADRAAGALESALELWRGAPFDVLTSWSPGLTEAARLGELRDAAEEHLLEARLHIGEHRDVVPIAEVRVAEQPLREHRWAILALALYRCGRQADALRALKRARATLVDQLGIEPGAELVALESAILRQDEALGAPPEPLATAERCPYKGLAAYDVDDTDTFFGRDQQVAACVERLRGNPLLVVTGPSGCGKSSLARAGLVPALQRAGHEIALFQPGSDAGAAMADALAACGPKPVVVVDQFEELFAFDDDRGTRSRGFCAQLADYATATAPVVITVRADHVAALAAEPRFAQLAERGLHLVTPLSGDSLRQAIEGPAHVAGLRLEPGLVDLLLRDSDSEPGGLPLLSHALVETWQRRDGRVLTVEGYRATGEIRGAVARSADRLYESLPADQRPKLRSVLLRLVSSSPNGEPVRTRVATRLLGGDAERERVLGLLVRARLVTAEEDSVELAHEALARAWPRLRSWLDEDAAGQRTLSHLAAAADGWDSLGRPDSELYRGARLDTVLEWRDATEPDLTGGEATFLDASVAAADAERHASAERGAALTRQRRRRRLALAGAAVLVVGAAASGFVAYQQRQDSARDRRDAAFRSLAATSEAQRSNHLDVAALLAVEAYRNAPTGYTEAALFGALTANPGLLWTTQSDVEFAVPTANGIFVPGGETLALADHDGAVHLLDLANGTDEHLAALDDGPGGRTVLDVSAEGRFLATFLKETGAGGGWVTVWDLTTREQRFAPVVVTQRSASVAISDDGAFVAIAGVEDSPTAIRDGATGVLLRTIEPVAPPSEPGILALTTSVAFAPDGRLAIGSPSGAIRFVDAATGDEVQRFEGPPGAAGRALLFGDDGTTLVSVGNVAYAAYDLATLELIAAVPDEGNICNSPAYSAVTNALYCIRARAIVAVDVATGDAVDVPGSRGETCGLVVSADGTHLAVESCVEGGAFVSGWRIDGGGPISRLAYPSSDLHAVQTYGFRGDESALVTWVGTSEAEATIAIDPATGAVLDTFPDIYNLLPTDDPAIVLATFGDDPAKAGTYDVVRHTALDLVDVGFPTEFYAWFGTRVAHGQGTDGAMPVSRLRVVDHDGGLRLGAEIEAADGLEIVTYWLDEHGLLLGSADADGERFQVERRDPDTGNLVGEPAVGYPSLGVGGGHVVLITTDGRMVEADPTTLQPIGLPFGEAGFGFTDYVHIDAQGRRVAVVGLGSLAFYDLATRTQLGGVIDVGSEFGWTGSAFRGDGLELAVDAGHGIVVWDLDPEHWFAAACRLAGRNLTRTEWDQYLGDLATYHQTCPAYPAA